MMYTVAVRFEIKDILYEIYHRQHIAHGATMDVNYFYEISTTNFYQIIYIL